MMESNFIQDISALKKLPKSWNVFDFGNVFTDISGGNKKFLKSDFLVEGKIAIIDQGKDLIAGYTNEENEIVKGQPPYIVFGDHTRIFKFIDFPFVMGADGTKVFKVKDFTISNEKYLFHFLNSLNIPNTGYNRHFKYLKSTKIPLPPLPQQQKIANILDAAVTLKQNDKALIAKYDALTQALFLEMFGDPVSNPKGWEMKSLNDLCNKITDGTHDTPKRLTEGVKFITGKHIRPFEIDYENSDYVTQEVHNEIYRRCNPEYGDILYTNIGVNFATAAMNTVDYEFSMKNVALLKYKRESLNGRFLESILNDEFFKDRLKRSFGIGGAQQFLSLSNIKSINILCPNLELQNQFAARVALIEQQKAIAQKSLEKSEALCNSLLQKAFNGGLT